jgi:aminobenzoyl-glutamate transport protein
MADTVTRRTFFDRFLDGIERAGNRLPDPVTLFLILVGLVMLASWLAATLGAAVVHPARGRPSRP